VTTTERRDASTTSGAERVASYSSRASRHAGERDVEARRSVLLSRLRLTTFLAGAALLILGLRGASPGLIGVAVALLAGFAALVVWHARVEERMAWHEALRVVNVRARARIERDWNALPDTGVPIAIDLNRHAYSNDLDLFGRASLFQWLGPAATAKGARTLAGWLVVPASPTEILERQRAVAALAPLEDWRERMAALGIQTAGARQQEIDRFLEWAEGPGTFGANAAWLRLAVYAIVASIWIGIALQAKGVTDAALWLTPMTAGIVLSFALARRVGRALDRAGAGQHAMTRYAALLAHAAAVDADSARIAGIRNAMTAGGQPAPVRMRQLNRVLGFGALRRGAAIFHFPIQALTLWDFHVIFALDGWRRRSGAFVRGWLDALADLDALSLLGWAAADNPRWCVPEFTDARVYDAEALGHPLIADDKRVANDVRLGPPGTVLLVTGSNMSGKSTLLRAIGLNAVLAHAGAPACAASLRMPSCDLQTSIRIQDSLELGLSYFMAALERLKGVVDAAEHERAPRMLLYLLDEILQGTNSAERAIAVRAVARHLLEAGAIGAMTTHDLTLAGQEPLASAARLVHFTETVDEDGVMRFDYRLRPGLATSRNALRLMRLIGIEP
jgi:MutS-like protein